MFTLGVTVSGDKVVLSNLQRFETAVFTGAQRGLQKSVRGIHPLAMAFLNGAGGAGRKAQIVGPSRGFTKKSGETVNFKPQLSGAGAYPVPVRTANLKRLLDFVDPGQSKFSNGVTFVAGPNEAVLYDSAEYAMTIHQGTGSSEKFGRRPYVEDALKAFNQGAGIVKAVEQEIAAEIQKVK